MAAATVDMPAIARNAGPMLDGHWNGKLVGSGTVIWEARRFYAANEIDYESFIGMVAASAPSAGHCNTMGTALSMNSLAEALGMMLPGAASLQRPTASAARWPTRPARPAPRWLGRTYRRTRSE